MWLTERSKLPEFCAENTRLLVWVHGRFRRNVGHKHCFGRRLPAARAFKYIAFKHIDDPSKCSSSCGPQKTQYAGHMHGFERHREAERAVAQ